MKRKIVITIEDSFIDVDTGDFQTNEDFMETVIEKSTLKYSLEEEFGDIKVLGITVE